MVYFIRGPVIPPPNIYSVQYVHLTWLYYTRNLNTTQQRCVVHLFICCCISAAIIFITLLHPDAWFYSQYTNISGSFYAYWKTPSDLTSTLKKSYSIYVMYGNKKEIWVKFFKSVQPTWKSLILVIIVLLLQHYRGSAIKKGPGTFSWTSVETQRFRLPHK